VLDLLKLSVLRIAKERGSKVAPQDIVLTLAQLTGLPVSILDNSERVDLEGVRSYFRKRVIGQNEAIRAVVDRIAMLKAGLNDPGKPIGVFLFAGPTGTGKTAALEDRNSLCSLILSIRPPGRFASLGRHRSRAAGGQLLQVV
jgi:ATP-dependent Clp protease ATP-binding subunit ClpC